MPLYEYSCTKCKSGFTRFLSLERYDEPQICECGGSARKLFSRPHIVNKFQSYQSPIDGRAITSERKRKDDLARSECVEYDPGMRQDADRRVTDEERKLEKQVDETVDKAVSEMSSDKLERLHNELSHGAEVIYERKTGD